eukprot:scaffold2830_cov131-Cylindrotheca_fusiformis.AAC.50
MDLTLPRVEMVERVGVAARATRTFQSRIFLVHARLARHESYCPPIRGRPIINKSLLAIENT